MQRLLAILLFVGIFMCSAVVTFLSGGLIAIFVGAVRDNSFSSENVATVFICAWIMALVMISLIGIGKFSVPIASSEEVAIETTVEAAE